jgi:hypothetical protein
MTETDMNEKLLLAQDMINTLIEQRDAANNAMVQLSARVKQLERAAAAKIEVPSLPSNGHDGEASIIN